MYFASSLVNMVSNAMLSQYGGDLFIAVMTIAASVRQLLETPALAICEGTSPIMSFNYGARNGGRVLKAIWIMTALTVGYTALAWGVIEWKPEWFIQVFCSDEKLVQAALPLLHIYLYAFVFQALQYSAQLTFKALNKKGRAIFFSLSGRSSSSFRLRFCFRSTTGWARRGCLSRNLFRMLWAERWFS